MGGREGKGRGGTNYISMGGDVLERDGEGAVFHCKNNLGRDSNIPVWKRVHVCLERLSLEPGYHKLIFVNDMKHQR